MLLPDRKPDILQNPDSLPITPLERYNQIMTDIISTDHLELAQRLETSRVKQTFTNSPEVVTQRGKYTSGIVMYTRLDYEAFGDIEPPSVVTLATPENLSITMGLLKYDDHKNLYFELPRFHTGWPAQLDLAIAMYQAAQTAPVHTLLARFANTPNKILNLELIREGQLLGWQKSIGKLYNLDTPATLVHVHHQADDDPKNPLKRISVPCDINFGSVDPVDIRLLTFSDGVASGRQLVDTTLKVFEGLKKDQLSLEHVLVVSPLLTLKGAFAYSQWLAQEYGVSVTFVTSGAMLGTDDICYMSPILDIPELCADPRVLPLTLAAHGELAQRACAKSDWASSFLDTKKALSESEKELQSYGYSNKDLMNWRSQITLLMVQKQLKDITSLMPYSTLLKAL